MANYILIKELCKKKGVTLKQLAETIGFSETGLLKIIKEETTKVKTLEDIARALRVPVSEFFSDDPNNRIYFTEKDYKTINEVIEINKLYDYKEQILSSFCYYDTEGQFITKDKIKVEILARYTQRADSDKKIKERDRLISIFQNTIEDLQNRRKVVNK